jgi:hypothetical protein
MEQAKEQLKELKKTGLKDQDCRAYLERFGLKENELDELLPGTKAVQTKAKEQRTLAERLERHEQVAQEMALYLRQLAFQLPKVDFQPRTHVGDVLAWAGKLEKLKEQA